MIGFDAVDLFAGPGGWDIAARQLGLRVLGVEKDDAACQTRRAAGLPTLQADVSALNPLDFTSIPLLIASPPCQTFSSAGNGAGRRQLADIVTAIRDGSENDLVFTDGRTGLVLEPLRWALTAEPASVALEQVPAVLPIWEAIADRLEQVGYTVATGLLHAEQYGVPQTRKRAVLVASRTDPVTLPAPTHRKYRKGVPQDAGDAALRPWVSMSDALGWGMTGRPSMTVTAGGDRGS